VVDYETIQFNDYVASQRVAFSGGNCAKSIRRGHDGGGFEQKKPAPMSAGLMFYR
jgi:hypothetical protein